LEREIAEARRCLCRNKLTLENLVQLACLGQVAEFGPVRIPTHTYDTRFAEDGMHLTEHERMSFNVIYDRVKQLNSKVDKFEQLALDATRDSPTHRSYAVSIDTQYRTTCDAIYMIDWHLSHKDNLEASDSDPALGREGWDLLTKREEDRLGQLAEEARALGPEGLKQKLAHAP